MDYVTILILADGETWTEADGCSMAVVSSETIEALMRGQIRIQDIEPIVEVGIKTFPC